MTAFVSACLPRFFLSTLLGLGALASASLASAEELGYQPEKELTANEQIRKADAETWRNLDNGKQYEMRGFQITRRQNVEVRKIVEFPLRKIVELPGYAGKRPVEIRQNPGDRRGLRQLRQPRSFPRLPRL